VGTIGKSACIGPDAYGPDAGLLGSKRVRESLGVPRQFRRARQEQPQRRRCLCPQPHPPGRLAKISAAVCRRCCPNR